MDEDRKSHDVDRLLETPDRKFRLIPIRSDSERRMIDEHLSMLAEVLPESEDPTERADAFTDYFEECRQMMARVVRHLWDGKKKYSLYTFRKQFSANVKAEFGSTVAAELMGHSGIDTPSAAHYGKANQAHRVFKSKSSDRTAWRPAKNFSAEGPADQGTPE